MVRHPMLHNNLDHHLVELNIIGKRDLGNRWISGPLDRRMLNEALDQRLKLTSTATESFS